MFCTKIALSGELIAATNDERAAETQEALDRARQRLDETESAAVAPARRAVDLIALASRTAELFFQQPGSEQRQLLKANSGWSRLVAWRVADVHERAV